MDWARLRDLRDQFKMDCWYMIESWERCRRSYTGVTIRSRSEFPIVTDPCVASRRTGSENVLVQNRPSAPPRFATGPLTGAAQWSSVGVTGYRIDSVRKHEPKILEKCSYSFIKVLDLLNGSHNQNSLGVPDRKRGLKKNGLRLVQFRKSDTGVYQSIYKLRNEMPIWT